MVSSPAVPTFASEELFAVENRDGLRRQNFKNLRWRDVAAYARWHRAMRLNISNPVVKDDIWE